MYRALLLTLLVTVSSLLFFGCSSKTIELKKEPKEGNISIFDDLQTDTLEVVIRQEGNKLTYEKVSLQPIPKNELSALYEKNDKNINADKEPLVLYDCLTLYKDKAPTLCALTRKDSYMYSTKYSIFNKKESHFSDDIGRGTIGLILLPFGMLADLGSSLEYDDKESQTQRLLLKDTIDTEALQKYGIYMAYTLSKDFKKATRSTEEYTEFLKRTGLVHCNSKPLVEPLLKLGTPQAYAVAYEMTHDYKYLKKAYPTLNDLNAYLKDPKPVVSGAKQNCFVVITSKLNMREKPSTKYKVVARLRKGDKVCNPVDTTSKKNWIEFEKGWLYRHYLKKYKPDMEKRAHLRRLKREYLKQNALQSSSIQLCQNYLKKYGNDTQVKQHLKKLYKQRGKRKGSEKDFQNAYALGASKDDLMDFIAHASLATLEKEYRHPSIVKSKSHREILKESIIQRLRKKDTLEAYKKAYGYSKSPTDLKGMLKHSNSIDSLEYMLASYKLHSYPAIQKALHDKLAALYREKHDFKGYLRAYEVSGNIQDGKTAMMLAHTPDKKARLELAVFKKLKHPEYLFTYEVQKISAYYSQDETSGGMFSKYSFYGYIEPYGNVRIALNPEAAFKPHYLKIKLTYKLRRTTPIHIKVRSRWIGNTDEEGSIVRDYTFKTLLEPPYENHTDSFHMKSYYFVYFDRGAAGGYTAKWPADDTRVHVLEAQAQALKAIPGKNQKLEIDFDKLDATKATLPSKALYIASSYDKGNSIISHVANIDANRIDRASSSSNYTASSSSSSAPSSSSTRSTSRSSSSSCGQLGCGGVKESYWGGYKSSNGYKIYIIRCNNGAKTNAFYENGWWKDGSGSSFGQKYRGMSLDRFASSMCGG